MEGRLPVLVDKRCRPGSLDNVFRRRLAPPGREIDLLGIVPGETVADVAAGVGYYAEDELERIGPLGHLWLFDVDATNLRRAERRLGADPRVTVRVAPANDLAGVPDGSVDRLLLSLALCCMVDKRGAMDEAWRVLRPGGRLLATYPSVGSPFRRRRRSLRVTREVWEALMLDHPWKVVAPRSGRLVRRHLLERP